MKRNWLTYVAITASLIAGFLCSTAFADNHGMKFSGGGHSMSGMGGAQRTMQFQQSNNQFRNLNVGGLQTIKNNNLQSGNSGRNLGITLGTGGNNGLGGLQQIKNGHFNGNLGQVLGQGGNNGNSGIVGRTPQIKINPGTFGGNAGGNQGNVLGNSGIKLGNTGIKVGNLGNGQGHGNGVGISLGNSNVRSAVNNINKQCHIAPKCIDPCFSKGCSPCGNTCSPCLKNWNVNCVPWWWTCHTHYCNHPVYYPVYTTPIVVAVPVAVPVGVPVVEKLVQVPVGSTVTMQALGLGAVPGRLILILDKASFESQIVDWNDGAVTATLPMLNLAAPAAAELVIVKGDGQPATSMKVELIPAAAGTVQPAVGQAAPATAVQQAQFNQPAGELSAAAALFQ